MDNSSQGLPRLKIAFIAQPEYFRFTYENDLDGVADVKEFRYHFSMTETDFSDLIQFGADINFFFRGEFVPRAVLERLPGIKVNLSSEPFPRRRDGRLEWTLDSLERYLTFRIIRNKPFDYVFHYDEFSLPYLKRDGLNLSGIFRFPVATQVYRPLPQEKKWDLFFIGRSTYHREKFFGNLKHFYSFLSISHGIWGADLVNYINASKICLNVHAENETSWEPRMQILLACQAFVISEKITPNPVLRPGVDFIQVSTSQELDQAVGYYLAHPEERQKISSNGYHQVQEYLDSRKVFVDLIDGIRKNRFPKYYGSRGSILLDLLSSLRDHLKQMRNRL
jgi:hypothetical protein